MAGRDWSDNSSHRLVEKLDARSLALAVHKVPVHLAFLSASYLALARHLLAFLSHTDVLSALAFLLLCDDLFLQEHH